MSDSQEQSQDAPFMRGRGSPKDGISQRERYALKETLKEALLVSAPVDSVRGELDSALRSQRAEERFSPELLGIISHELRSPLAAIKGYAATLRRHESRLSRAERKDFLDAIDEASDRLTLIVERILELSQLEMGLVTLNREPVAIVRLVKEAVAAAERRIASSHVGNRQFTFVFDEGNLANDNGSRLVLADARYLRDVLDNLIENAIKYSPNGGLIEINLSRGRLRGSEARHALQLVIHDSGIGIADEHLTRIFETFHRVDVQPTRATDGLGLGLAICKKIVELHEGDMRAESVQGVGSSFHIALPLADDDEDFSM